MEKIFGVPLENYKTSFCWELKKSIVSPPPSKAPINKNAPSFGEKKKKGGLRAKTKIAPQMGPPFFLFDSMPWLFLFFFFWIFF